MEENVTIFFDIQLILHMEEDSWNISIIWCRVEKLETWPTDGMNPYGNLSSKHNSWPILVQIV